MQKLEIQNIINNIRVNDRQYLMDATFKVCPNGEFKQLLIIYIEYIESVSICINYGINKEVLIIVISFRPYRLSTF